MSIEDRKNAAASFQTLVGVHCAILWYERIFNNFKKLTIPGLLCRGGEHEYRLTKYLLSNYEQVRDNHSGPLSKL